MIKKLKNVFLKVSVLGLLLAPVMAPAAVLAQAADPSGGIEGDQPSITGNLCGGADALKVDASASCDDTAVGEAGESVNSIIATVINIFSVVVGVVAVVMIIIGGFRYITSGGDSSNVTGAKNTILFAVVGLIIVALAQIIVRFVLARATGAAATGA
ncbi:MAG TPA: hypothetical protein VK694_01540 [Verrucomicrobiae bacterium]|nr:hypothetical protein [Verrucomicrobiae bacterium]